MQMADAANRPAGGGATARQRHYAWQDPARVAEGIGTLSGLEYLRRFIAEGRSAPVQDTLGFTLDEVAEGSSVWTLTPAAYQYNAAGTVQGGVYAAVLDAAMAVAIWSTLPAGCGWTTLELKINILRPMTEASGPVRCESRLIHCGRQTGTSEARLIDAQGRIYAHGTTTCMIMRPKGE